jgi:hypothetical protein
MRLYDKQILPKKSRFAKPKRNTKPGFAHEKQVGSNAQNR